MPCSPLAARTFRSGSTSSRTATPYAERCGTAPTPKPRPRAGSRTGTLTLKWEHYLTTIVAADRNGSLEGRVEMRGDKDASGSPFHAVRHVEAPAAETAAPAIGG